MVPSLKNPLSLCFVSNRSAVRDFFQALPVNSSSATPRQRKPFGGTAPGLSIRTCMKTSSLLLSWPICPSVTLSEKPMNPETPLPPRRSALDAVRGAIRKKGSASMTIKINKPTETRGSRRVSRYFLFQSLIGSFRNRALSGATSSLVCVAVTFLRDFWISNATTVESAQSR